MVVRRKICDICKYHVCSEEEYLSASTEVRQQYARKWIYHLKSKQHHLSVSSINKRTDYHLNVEGKDAVLNDMNATYIRMLNKEYPYLLPEGKKIKAIHFEYYDDSITDYCDEIFKEHGFIVSK